MKERLLFGRSTTALIAILLAISFVLTGCIKPNDDTSKTESENGEESQDGGLELMNNIALGMPYSYSYIRGSAVKTDTDLTLLTDGKRDAFEKISVKQRIENRGDWSGSTRDIKAFLDEDAAFYYLSLDLGFVSEISRILLTFPDAEDCVLPKGAELYVSDDGYNFTKYIGAADKIEDNAILFDYTNNKISAKAIRVFIYSPVGTHNAISEIEVEGKRSAELVLHSKGAKYTWNGEVRANLEDDGKKLTDGNISSGSDKENVVAKKSDTKDDITKINSEIITLDLGEVKDVSQIVTDALARIGTSSGLPERLNVRYSVDGEEYKDFGQVYIATTAGNIANSRNRFLVTRNHTVKARYIMLVFHTSNILMLDEISVYGSDSVVDEPKYDFVSGEIYSNTNIASFRDVKLNGSSNSGLTDMLFTKDSISVDSGKESVFEFDADNINDNVVSASITMQNNDVLSVEGSYTTDDGSTKTINGELHWSTVGSLTTVNFYFEKAVKGKDYKFVVKTRSDAKITEFQLFAIQPQLPLVRGGFFQLPTSGGINPSALNSEYAWYLQLKGMKDLGMDYVVIQYSAHYLAKTTLINGENIKALGYKYNPTYGSLDVAKAVLDAAEKLGMKVWLGTIHDADFNNISSGKAHYDAIVEAGRAVIKDIDEMYGTHPAFEGYYLSDETCDAWLNSSGGVEAARKIYKGQSDLIHEIAPEKSVMIAPAIWRSGPPQRGADNLYAAIAPENEGGRPVVDIVAAQDCLGRENEIFITDEVYDAFETYLERWALAVRKAGAEFWNDTEVFDVTSTPKRGFEVIKSLELEAKYTNSTIVFDIPHYFTSFPLHNYDKWPIFILDDVMREYVKFYSELRDNEYRNKNTSPPVDVLVFAGENGGSDIEIDESHLVKHEDIQAKAKSTKTVPNFDSFDTDMLSFVKSDTGYIPEYKLMWDDENLYLLVKSGDKTPSFGKGAWWEGNDDLLQLWITADGSLQSDVLDSDYGIRFYLHHESENNWTKGYESSAKMDSGVSGIKFDTKSTDDGTLFIIIFNWDDMGRKAPKVDDKTAFGIKIQYIDGDGGNWSSSDGGYDRGVGAKALFGFE